MSVCLKFISWQERESAKKHDETRVAIADVVHLNDVSLQLFAYTVRISTVVIVINSKYCIACNKHTYTLVFIENNKWGSSHKSAAKKRKKY